MSQGKGLDDDGAMASALMEAIEFAVAEQPDRDGRLATAAELQRSGELYCNPSRLLPPDEPFRTDHPIRWVAGRNWPSADDVWIPLDALTLGGDPADLPRIGRSSNGLASGNCAEEALFHAVCELLERDATSLWSLLSDTARVATEFDVAQVDDASVRDLTERIEAAGLELRLFDQTTELGVPCVMAVIRESDTGASRSFDLAAGYGCHPVGSRAVVRAITEAAQTRITNIAGGRDDFLPDEYLEQVDETILFLELSRTLRANAPTWLASGTPLPEMLDQLADRVGPEAGIVWAELGGADHQISVVRALSTMLEDRETNANWYPGERALRVLGR